MRAPWMQAVAFLTPIGGAAPPTPRAVAWFPLVGAVIGAGLGVVWWAASQVWNAPVAAAVVVALDLALTGMLHFDGLVDSADGLLPPLDRGRRLEVMADPVTGAFGVGAAVSVLLLRWAALVTLHPSVALLACVWCGSRYLMAVATTHMRYARPHGLARAFVGARSRVLPVGGAMLGATLAAFGHFPAATALVALGVAGSAVLGLADRRIGGFTGDVLGAAGMVGETVGLLAAAAHR